MAKSSPELLAHQEWLGQIQPVGLVVSASVLVKQGVFVDRQQGIEKQLRLRELLDESGDTSFFSRARSLSGRKACWQAPLAGRIYPGH